MEIEDSNLPYYLKSDDDTFDSDDYCNLRHGFEFSQGWAVLADVFSHVVNDLMLTFVPPLNQMRTYMQVSSRKNSVAFAGRDALT